VASEFDTEQLNVITKNVSLDTFNQFTKLLREVTRFLLPQLILIAAISYLMRGAYLLQEQRR
jgi:ubiquinone/menaquinone biosynthesis C-methylase UbiE